MVFISARACSMVAPAFRRATGMMPGCQLRSSGRGLCPRLGDRRTSGAVLFGEKGTSGNRPDSEEREDAGGHALGGEALGIARAGER
jgi:hypothetical protein